jgi:hypothetical protein
MNFFRFNHVYVAQDHNLIRVYYDHKMSFQFQSKKGYIDYADVWMTQIIMKGLMKHGRN